MFAEELSAIKRVYSTLRKNNKTYQEVSDSLLKYREQLNYIRGLSQGVKILDGIIANAEAEWRQRVLRTLEADIMEALNFVYPSDGYTVKLSTRVVRNKMHIDSRVSSYFTGDMSGDVSDSQGRLFQQIVSCSALTTVMRLLGVDTVYVDEAFSGASKRNVERVNALLRHLQSKGFNIILIAQDRSMADGIDANVLFVQRSIDNKTSIVQNGGS